MAPGILVSESRACHPTNREVLLDFKKRIIADSHGLLHSWLPNKDCCIAWEGIACDPSSGRVLNLTRPGLPTGNDVAIEMSSTLSPFLGNLSSLQVLNLANPKDLKGHIPPELGKLKHLLLHWNNLEGSIPGSIHALKRLEFLCLYQNRLTGHIPRNLFDEMTSLSELWLTENRLSGTIPESIGSLSKLQTLALGNNSLTGNIPASIGNLRLLRNLWLENNRLSGKIPAEIMKLTHLRYISVYGNIIVNMVKYVYVNKKYKIAFIATRTLDNAISRNKSYYYLRLFIF